MGDFNFFDNWNKTLRWIAFVPMLCIAYVITFLLGKVSFWYGYGWMGLSEDSVVGFLILHFYLSFVCFCIPILVSVSCAPNGKIIIASIYVGLILILFGFSLFSTMTYGDGRPLWQSVYDYVLNLAGAILALVSVISEEKRNKESELFLNT